LKIQQQDKSIFKMITSSKVFAFPVIIVFLSTYLFITKKMKSNAELETYNSLETVLVTTQQALRSWQSTLLATTKVWAESKDIKNVAQKLLNTPHEKLKQSKWQAVVRQYLGSTLQTHDYRGFFIIDKNLQNLSSLRNQNINVKNLLSEQQGFFNEIWKGRTVISELVESDVVLTGALQVSIFTGAPIRNDRGEVVGAFCFRIDPSRHFSKILERGRIGRTGETYAISKNGMMASESRFTNQLVKMNILKKDEYSILNFKLTDPGVNLVKGSSRVAQPNLPLILSASRLINSPNRMNIQSQLTGYRDYRGVLVAGAWVWDDELKIGITTELEIDEAYASFHRNKRIIQILIFLTCSFLLVILYLFDKNNRWLKKIIQARTSDLENEVSINEKIARELESQKFAMDQHALVSITDPRGNIIYANDLFCKISQYSKSELMGQNHRLINSGVHSNEFWKECWDTVKNGKTWKSEVANKAKDGSIYWVDGTIVPFKNGKGEITQFIAIHSDITERKNAEIKLKEAGAKVAQSQRLSAIGVLAAGVGHEINNPLTISAGNLSLVRRLLKKEDINWDKIESAFEKQEIANERIRKIVDGLRVYARVDSDDLEISSIGAAINQTIGLLSEIFEKRA